MLIDEKFNIKMPAVSKLIYRFITNSVETSKGLSVGNEMLILKVCMEIQRI